VASISLRTIASVKSITFVPLTHTCMCGGLPSMRARISLKSVGFQSVGHNAKSKMGVLLWSGATIAAPPMSVSQ
jgi:hypothetical protein